MALGGWKSGQMMRRYAAVTDQTLRAAAEAVSGHEPVPTQKPGGDRSGNPRRGKSRPQPSLGQTRSRIPTDHTANRAAPLRSYGPQLVRRAALFFGFTM